ncbi:MAG: hypothetical protein K2N99_00315, partial [Malacoplasma sp.]|nr:hypothetical protein [Malacoplasma sp.]
DGTCKTEPCTPKVFVNAETNVKTGARVIDAKFTYSLYNHSEKLYPTGNYTKNDHHKFDDLILTFTDDDGKGFTDLNDIFVTVNGMVYDYVLGPAPNQITLNDVVKYAAHQIKSVKSGYNPDSHLKFEQSAFGKRIMTYDLPYEAYGYNYEFEINVYKWNNISVSHFIQPVTTKKLLKTEPMESNKSFWLVDTLVFSEMVDKDKCILLCGNTIVDKDTWHVEPDGSVKLDVVSIEFDLIYSEMWKRMQEYQIGIIGHVTSGAPTLNQFLKDNYATKDEIDKAFELYKDAMEQWRKDNDADNWHYTKSPFVITQQQFNKRQYAIIKFESIEPKNFTIEVTENRTDIELNKPYHNKFRNKNWSINDIIVMNGVIHRFVNEYADVFVAPQKWYRPETYGIFDDASAYKLQIGKRQTSMSIYHKLNYTELLNGPVEGNEYYNYNEERKAFLVDTYLKEFKCRYLQLDSTVISSGMDPHTVYFNKIDGKFVRVPQTQTEFKEDTNYYICEFLEDYYIKRK